MTVQAMPDTVDLRLKVKPTFSADNLAEIQANAGTLAGNYVLSLDDNKVYIVRNDETVAYTGFDVGAAGTEGDSLVFIQPDAPTVQNKKYLWIQTDFLEPGGVTIWYEDLED